MELRFILKTKLSSAVFICLLFFAFTIRAQNEINIVTANDTLLINFDNYYPLGATNIVPFSEEIYLGKEKLADTAYAFNYSNSSFRLSKNLAYSIFDTLFIRYKTILTSLQKEYRINELVVRYDDITADTVKVLRSAAESLTGEEIFGPGIQKSGTLVRGFTVGTNKDFSVSSGLRLQLSGKLSEDIEIVAALTDENTPIQPEGNTERLEELDKVFIKIQHPNAAATFGDYELNYRSGEFGVVDRKLQGLLGEVNYKDHFASFAVAGARGKYNSMQFNGNDGVQGPYRLQGAENESGIIVIAGSETVFIDGEQVTRGENNAYTIDYANAEITFTSNVLITSATRITVDFEYTARLYERNFLSGAAGSGFSDGKLKISAQFFRESDDKENPIDLYLSDEDKEVLKAAGDGRAGVSGVKLAEPDSLGRTIGIYIQRDTVIAGVAYPYYIYAPGNPEALYDVDFSYVGPEEGSYVKVSLGNYRFAGPGNGAYAPVRLLPRPEAKDIGNIVIDAEPWEDVSVNLSLSGSRYDRNLYSYIDDNDNNGYARNILIEVKPKKINLAGFSPGKIGFRFKDRFIEERYQPFDRINDIEFSRQYNITSETGSDEILRETALTWLPVDKTSLYLQYGYYNKPEIQSSDRYVARLMSTSLENLKAAYDFDYVETDVNERLGSWLRQKGDVSYGLWKFEPGFYIEHENKKDRFQTANDSLLDQSHIYLQGEPYLKLTDLGGLDMLASYTLRDEYFPSEGEMSKASTATTKTVELNYKGSRNIRSLLRVAFRDKEYTEEFKNSSNKDNETILIRSQTHFSALNNATKNELFYEVATERTSRLERVFVRVPKGTGEYEYLGDLNNNGIADENEFEQSLYEGDFTLRTIPTEELFPVIDLNASYRTINDLSNVIKGNSFILKALKSLSTESLLRVEEKSTEPKLSKIYLLNLSSFLNDSTTVTGSQTVQQDVHVFKNERDFSLRFRYLQRRSLSQYSGYLEHGYYRERSVRLNLGLIEEIGNQTELIETIDYLTASENSRQSRQAGSISLTTDFSYRPTREIEVGFKVGTGSTEDLFPEEPTTITSNSQTLRFAWHLAGKGRLRIETERTELIASSTENYIPFEITRGNQIGKNYIVRVNFDYRISSNLQSTVSYDGRSRASDKIIHSLRAEARAYF